MDHPLTRIYLAFIYFVSRATDSTVLPWSIAILDQILGRSIPPRFQHEGPQTGPPQWFPPVLQLYFGVVVQHAPHVANVSPKQHPHHPKCLVDELRLAVEKNNVNYWNNKPLNLLLDELYKSIYLASNLKYINLHLRWRADLPPTSI